MCACVFHTGVITHNVAFTACAISPLKHFLKSYAKPGNEALFFVKIT